MFVHVIMYDDDGVSSIKKTLCLKPVLMVICGVKYCARKVRVTIEPFIQHVKSRMEDRVGVMLGARVSWEIF